MLINACCIHCCLSRINSLFSLYYANMLIKWNQNFWMMFKISLAVRSKLTRCLRARQNFWLFSELKSPWNHNWRFLFFMEFSLINLINVLLYCLIFNIFYLYVCMLSLAINTGHTANVFFYITRVLLSNYKIIPAPSFLKDSSHRTCCCIQLHSFFIDLFVVLY